MSLVKVYKYYAEDRNPWRFQYSTNPNAGNGWRNAGLAFQAPASSESGAVSVLQYRAEDPWRYAYSTKTQDPEFTKSGWISEGVAFHALKSQQPGSIPVYRLRAKDNNPWRYQYVTSSDLPAAGDGWINEGVAFYAYP